MYVVNGNILVDHFSRVGFGGLTIPIRKRERVTVTEKLFRLYATGSVATAVAIILYAVCCMWCDLYFVLFYIISDKVEHNVTLR